MTDFTSKRVVHEECDQTDIDYMRLAYQEAERAEKRGEVPVGAVLVLKAGEVLAAAGNRKEELSDPTAHAEMLVIRKGLGICNKYLTDCTLYVTLEPCAMCAGAMVNTRLHRLVFAAADPKSGAAGTVLNVLQNPTLNHRVEVTGGVLADESAALLGAFFKRRRAEKKGEAN